VRLDSLTPREIVAELDRFIVGQNAAKRAVAVALRNRWRRQKLDPSLREEVAPKNIIMIGPTGVGKTQTAKTLAKFLFDSEEAIVRLDMSEYMEKHAVSRLVGAPPGYVGYDEGGQLTEAVRRKPYSVVLFDEVEKAHPDVFNMLLQVLDDGRLTDNKGVTVDFTNTIIIMTSNIASDKIMALAGDPEMEKQVFEELKFHFKPEFLNRLDDTVVFNPLGAAQIAAIVDLFFAEIQEKVVERDITLELSPEAKAYIAEAGFDPVFGARPLKRALYEIVEDRLADLILEERVTEGSTVRFGVRDGEIAVEIA
jgi:ATP-dependent Clp protease ATP-binding subunit ClpB